MGCCALLLASWISPRFVLFLMWVFGDRLDFAFDESLVDSAYRTYHGDMIATGRGEVLVPEAASV